MPPVLSKPAESVSVLSILKSLLLGKKSKALSFSIIIVILVLIRIRTTKNNVDGINLKAPIKKKSSKGQVDMVFFKRISELIKIVVPSFKSWEMLNIVTLTVFLVVRTFLSIYIANVNGRIVKSIINANYEDFVKKIINLGILAIPSSFVNSYLDYLVKRLSLDFRTRLTMYFHNKYMKDMIYYQITNIDTRVNNPDQRLTTDVEKWAQSLANLYSNFTKPFLDLVLFSRKLSDVVGWEGPFFVIFWYFISGWALRFISPPFGKLTAIEQRLEGEYRTCHSDLVNHAEEIAFYKGQEWEKTRIHNSFLSLHKHTITIMFKRLYMGCFDNFLVKYGAGIAGYAIVGLPVFGKKKEIYLKSVKGDPSIITKDYVRNSSLLINLAKAIGRLVVSYKEIQSLAGYSTLIFELKEVFEEIEQGKFERAITSLDTSKETEVHVTQNLKNLEKGVIEYADYIKFENVPITTPNGDNLISSLNLEILPGMHCIITGPNGCGKSSLFRILGALWPLFGGRLHKPQIEKLFYVPQRPYLPAGTLRDQIIYPQSLSDLKEKNIKDEDLQKILEDVHLAYLVDREGGFEANNDWNDVLSGGEKQRIAMARLIYHKPIFAILDECTSAVSMDVESNLYSRCKEKGITLFTVSHRTSLFKHHNYLLKFDGEGNWSFEKLQNQSSENLKI